MWGELAVILGEEHNQNFDVLSVFKKSWGHRCRKSWELPWPSTPAAMLLWEVTLTWTERVWSLWDLWNEEIQGDSSCYRTRCWGMAFPHEALLGRPWLWTSKSIGWRGQCLLQRAPALPWKWLPGCGHLFIFLVLTQRTQNKCSETPLSTDLSVFSGICFSGARTYEASALWSDREIKGL